MALRRFTAAEWKARPLRRVEPDGSPEQRDAVHEICQRVATEVDAALC